MKHMKKYIVLGLCLGICWLGFSYQRHLFMQRGKQLVTDAYYGELISVKNDLEKGAPVAYTLTFSDSQRDYKGQTFNALHAAASSGNEDLILYLLEQGIDINSSTPQGWTPLYVATRDGQAQAAKLLVFRGADLNIQTDLQTTALSMVVTQTYPSEKERLDLLEYMLKRGAEVNLPDVYEHTPLFYAKSMDNQAVVALLEQYGAK